MWCVYSCWLFLLMLFPSHLSAQIYDECDSDYDTDIFEFFDLYLKLEDSLINYYKSPAVLEELRAVFKNTEVTYIDFIVDIQVVNGTNVSCGGEHPFTEYWPPAFCPASSDTSEYNWELCQSMWIHYINVPLSEVKSKNVIIVINQFLVRASYVHGNGLSLLLVMSNYYDYIFMDQKFWNDEFYDSIPITIRIDRLDCNPSMQTMTCDASDLFSWIKVYAEAGGRPQTWDVGQKGTTTTHYNDVNYVMKLLGWSISKDLIYKLCLAEYALISISLVLMIAKFFPVYHSKLVSMATTLEYKSLYWGAAVVSNCFTLGLLFPFGRAWSITLLNIGYFGLFGNNNIINTYITLLPILEITMYIAFFVAAVIATRRSNVGIIHIPTGMAKVLIHISSCFCCCCCCSSRCRAKAIQVLVLFSFMSFIYHSIMDAISVGYMLFINVSDTFTMTMLYISLLFFTVSLTSVILYTTSTRRDSGSAVKRSVKCVIGACMVLSIFCAVILIVAVYVTIISSLKPKGVIGFLTTLIPSLGLSAAGWFIKKKLQSEVQPNQQALDYGVTGQSLNDGRRENRENSEDTDEQRHLLA